MIIRRCDIPVQKAVDLRESPFLDSLPLRRIRYEQLRTIERRSAVYIFRVKLRFKADMALSSGHEKDDKFEYRLLDADYTPAEMLGSCCCYRYQACEAPGYYESCVPEWLQQLQDAIGDRDEIELTYGKIPWGIGCMWR